MNVPLNKATIIVPIPIPTIPWNKNKDMIKDKIRNVQSKQVLNIFKVIWYFFDISQGQKYQPFDSCASAQLIIKKIGD